MRRRRRSNMRYLGQSRYISESVCADPVICGCPRDFSGDRNDIYDVLYNYICGELVKLNVLIIIFALPFANICGKHYKLRFLHFAFFFSYFERVKVHLPQRMMISDLAQFKGDRESVTMTMQCYIYSLLI